uniref:F-box domain-containing protein n=1 Tax=Caenorhabditis tropicalis TaxID=1561998 RepID=A0A1I7U908_9PELO
MPLIPKKPSTCHSYLFVLLSQPSTLQSLQPFCEGMCEERKKFRLELFKQQHGLRLSALSTVSSCYDLPYAYHILMKDASQNRTQERRGKHRTSLHSPMSTEVCAAFHVSPHHKCPISSFVSTSSILFSLLVALAHFF